MFSDQKPLHMLTTKCRQQFKIFMGIPHYTPLQNLATLDVTNSSLETVIFDLKEMIGILDLRTVGYYKIKQGIFQQNVSKYYRFESADILCEHFNGLSSISW